MKSIVCAAVAVASMFSGSSFAQSSNGSLTRAQVRDRLVQLEQVGYRASTHDSDYPRDIQAAETKVQALSDSSHGADTAYGMAGVQVPACAQ